MAGEQSLETVDILLCKEYINLLAMLQRSL